MSVPEIGVYDKGEIRRFECTFTDADGVNADPTTVTFQITSPSGTVITEVYGESPCSILNDETGVFYRDVQLDESGHWYGMWSGDGQVQVKEPFQVLVKGTGY